MHAIVADIIDWMENIAPSYLAQKWDNVGLQVGQRQWPVNKVWIALDPLLEVVQAACSNQVDLLITHHPLIFKPLRALDLSTPTGAVLAQCVQHRLALFSAHTNLDSTRAGLNDLLAERVGLSNLQVLDPANGNELSKLVFFVPAAYEEKMLRALFETPAGKIGHYSNCSFRSPGTGTYLPANDAHPFAGQPGQVSHAQEVRIESVVAKRDLALVIQHLRAHHPYETMAYDVYPLADDESAMGIGRIGTLSEPLKLIELAEAIKNRLQLKQVVIAGDPDLKVLRAAVCTGSGSSLVEQFLGSGAQVFISGDLRYHDARAIAQAGRGLIDIGHFASEHLMVEALAKRLKDLAAETELKVEIEPCHLERDPFVVLSSR
jgi:dinuclear metal center YbgI/SA1388 family protein